MKHDTQKKSIPQTLEQRPKPDMQRSMLKILMDDRLSHKKLQGKMQEIFITETLNNDLIKSKAQP